MQKSTRYKVKIILAVNLTMQRLRLLKPVIVRVAVNLLLKSEVKPLGGTHILDLEGLDCRSGVSLSRHLSGSFLIRDLSDTRLRSRCASS